jgi:hypothetical protein
VEATGPSCTGSTDAEVTVVVTVVAAVEHMDVEQAVALSAKADVVTGIMMGSAGGGGGVVQRRAAPLSRTRGALAAACRPK